MEITIRAMTAQDKSAVLEMMRVFYTSPAVYTNGSDEIFESDIDACVQPNPYLEGYIFEGAGAVLGYAMAAKSFSTEFGKPCVWIEDLYIKEDYRGCGIGTKFMDFIAGKYAGCILRLEVEEENRRAIRLYKTTGFSVLPYMEMIK